MAACYRVAVSRGSTIAGLVSAAVLGGAAVYLLRPPAAEHRRRAAPAVTGAFKDGGIPARDPAIEPLLDDRLADLVIAADRERSGETHEDFAAVLRSPPALVAHGPALARAWDDMVGTLDRWVHVPMNGRRFSELSDELTAKVRAVSDALAAANLGYYLEAEITESDAHARAMIRAYRVEEVVYVDAGGEPRRVLSLRRLDHLNNHLVLLGMEAEGDPVVLLDQIDELVATRLLPVLAAGAPFDLGDDAWQQVPSGAALSAAVGARLRDEVGGVLGSDAAAIGALLRERAAIVRGWRAALEARGYRLGRTDALALPADMIPQLAGLVDRLSLERASAIEDRLVQLDAARTAASARTLVAATVRRHEAQHGLDEDRDEPLRYPAPLENWLGPERDRGGEPRKSVLGARLELAAYTSQIANDPTTPHLALWSLARHAFTRDAWGSSESYAAVIVIEGLARHLGVQPGGPVIHDGAIDRDRLVALATPLTARSGAELRTAATALWLELYGEPVVPIVDRR
jgi:hypothetical protein